MEKADWTQLADGASTFMDERVSRRRRGRSIVAWMEREDSDSERLILEAIYLNLGI